MGETTTNTSEGDERRQREQLQRETALRADGIRGVYLLTIRPGASGAPETIRVRRALKVLLRSFGLRCVAIEHAPQKSEAAAGRR